MAETKSSEEATLPTKRKAQDHDNSSLKAPKIVPQDKIEDNEENQTSKNNNLGTPVPESRTGDQEPVVDAEEDEDGDYEDEDDDDGEGEGDAPADKKGKGILIEEDDDDEEVDDDDDDSSDGEDDESGGESDLSDDPLAEVDLDNILPSRTRRRVVQPQVHISNDHGKKRGDDDS